MPGWVMSLLASFADGNFLPAQFKPAVRDRIRVINYANKSTWWNESFDYDHVIKLHIPWSLSLFRNSNIRRYIYETLKITKTFDIITLTLHWVVYAETSVLDDCPNRTVCPFARQPISERGGLAPIDNRYVSVRNNYFNLTFKTRQQWI